MPTPNPKDEEIKVRVPGTMKHAIKALAESRYTSESEITRQALFEYVAKYAPGVLKDASPTLTFFPTQPGHVSYRGKRRKNKKG